MSDTRTKKLAIAAELTGPAAAAIQYAWQGIGARFGNKAVSHAGTPRITFLAGAFDTLRAAAFVDAVELASRQIGSFTIQLSGVVLRNGVLTVAASLTNDLRFAYGRFYDACPEAGLRILPEYSPEIWTPNCPLTACDLPADQLPGIEAYLRSHSFAWRCTIQTVDLVRVEDSGHQRLETWPLMGETELAPTAAAV